jgi:hypothetical protein
VSGAAEREARIGEVVAAVVAQALADRGATRVALLDDGSPEATLAARLLEGRLTPGALVRVASPPPALEPVLHRSGTKAGGEELLHELRRLHSRLLPDAVAASATSKTALLLGGELPPEPLLPLGDLFASEVRSLAGGWSAPAGVRALAEEAGGIERLDAALRARLDGRDPDGLLLLPAPLRARVEALLARGRAARAHPRIVPKLGVRTLCVDLFE